MISEPSTSDGGDGCPLIEGIQLSSTTKEFDVKKCILCQQHNKYHNVTSGLYGRENIKRAATIRQDEKVCKRLKIVAESQSKSFVYHLSKCYKSYTMKKTLESIAKSRSYEETNQEMMYEVADLDTEEPESISKSLRSGTSARAKASSKVHPDFLPCVVCGCVRSSFRGKKVREKFRICEKDRAEMFLQAAQHFHDNVFDRVSDLSSAEAVFAADLFSHKHCIKGYIIKYRRSLNPSSCDEKIPVSVQKHTLFLKALDHIDPLLEKGYGFTVSDITVYLGTLEKGDHIILQNRDVKQLLMDHYGDKIQFAQNPRRNASELVYSSAIHPSELATKIKNQNILHDAGNALREILQQVNFGLGDKFCDAEELQNSWEATAMPDGLMAFFSALFSIPKASMVDVQPLVIPDDEEMDMEGVPDANGDCDSSRVATNQLTQLHCLFQILTYHLHKGRQKTPLQAMVGQSTYGKTRSRTLITTLNHTGVSTSYNEVKRARNLLASYAVLASEANGTPVPSHFNDSGFCIGAMDNSDYADKSSLSGTHSKHYTAMVLFQDAALNPGSKPSVSSTLLSKSSPMQRLKLPCQIVPIHHKPIHRPSLPSDFLTRENCNIDLNKAECAAREFEKVEFLITLVRCGLPHSAAVVGELPTWGGIHALITQSEVPVMRVGFLPVIPKPVTEYATVHKALINFQSVRHQLCQTVLPLFCDEGVFHTVADIVMHDPYAFSDIFPMMGMFHYSKVLLRCAGRLLIGTGIDDGITECGIFGKKVLQSVLSGSHYVRSLKGLLIVSEMLDSLKWKAFFAQNSDDTSSSLMQSFVDLKDSLARKSNSTAEFNTVSAKASELQERYLKFTAECEARSALCSYLGIFQSIVHVIKQLITADRDGNWLLHVAAIRSSMKILRAFDCINYLRYASWYLERIEVLEVEQPLLFQHFMMGKFVVKDRESGKFCAVAPDMKLEQSINRSEKGPGGHVIVGSSGDASIVAEFELLFHEITGITNLLNSLTNARVMAHLEATTVHHELYGNKGKEFDINVSKLLDFVLQRENPYEVKVAVPLHNIVTKEIVHPTVQAQLLNALKNGENQYQAYRQERFIIKSKKLSATISKVSLPLLSSKPPTVQCSALVSKAVVAAKEIAHAHRAMEIVKERGMPISEIMKHDLLPCSPLFDGDFTTKPDKSQFVAEIEQHLTTEHYNQFNRQSPLKTHVLLDFMSKIRQYRDLTYFTNLGEIIQAVMTSTKNVCDSELIHIIFDSYNEFSIKEGERIRRGGKSGVVDLINISEEVPIPKQLDKFWASGRNKEQLQELVSKVASRDMQHVVISGMVRDGEVTLAKLVENSNVSSIPELSNWQEEADCRIIPHIEWSVGRGCQRAVVISNDTDSVALILRYVHHFIANGLLELWVQFGTGDRRRMIPLHIISQKLGRPLCLSLLKAHVLTGDDSMSRIGTKHAALAINPTQLLANFAETDALSDEDLHMAERFLVQVWAGARSKTAASTFDELRHEVYMSPTFKGLEMLPPTSSVIHGHLYRGFFVLRNALTLISSTINEREPGKFGWESRTGQLLPTKFLRTLPDEKVVTCQCTSKCETKRCRCKAASVSCVTYCHKDSRDCKNKEAGASNDGNDL